MRNRGRELSESEIQELVVVETPSTDEELSRLTQLDAYQFSDGRILFLFEGEPATGSLWDSRSAVLESLRRPTESTRDHVLNGRFPLGRNFPERIPELVAHLADQLELQDEELNFTVESLKRLDARMKERIKPEDRLGSGVFPSLVAYLGEVVRQRVEGTWEMRHAGHAEVWEPWIHSPDGREFAPFICLFEQLTNHGDPSARLLRAVPAWAQTVRD